MKNFKIFSRNFFGLWVYKGGIGHPYPYLSSEEGVTPPDSKERTLPEKINRVYPSCKS
jgi:hypothetical protein